MANPITISETFLYDIIPLLFKHHFAVGQLQTQPTSTSTSTRNSLIDDNIRLEETFWIRSIMTLTQQHSTIHKHSFLHQTLIHFEHNFLNNHPTTPTILNPNPIPIPIPILTFHYHYIHLLTNELENIITNKLTTELIKDYECTIKDIKDMYNGTHDNNRGKRLINYHRDMRFVIAKEELEFICCQMWDRLLMEYQEQLEVTIRIRRETEKYHNKGETDRDQYKEYTNITNISKSNQTNTLYEQLETSVGELLQEITILAHNVTFLGGYNRPLQKLLVQWLLVDLPNLVTPSVERQTFFVRKSTKPVGRLLTYLELVCYLEQLERKHLSKGNIKLFSEHPTEPTADKDSKESTFTLSEPPTTNTNTTPTLHSEDKSNCSQLSGQLASILHILANLTHLCPESLPIFSFPPTYPHLRLILSFTQISTMTPTVREWAILIIRNLIETDEINKQTEQDKYWQYKDVIANMEMQVKMQ